MIAQQGVQAPQSAVQADKNDSEALSGNPAQCSNEARQPAGDTRTHTQSIKKALKILGPFVKENEKSPHKNHRIKREDSSKYSKTPKNLVLNPRKKGFPGV